MNNKGFTLVEILAVIALIAILFTVAVPGVMKISTKSKDSMYKNKISMIEDAATLYVDDYGVEDTKLISVNDLLNYNYLKKEKETCSGDCISNPKDDTGLDNKKICVCKVNNRATAQVIDGTDLSSCSSSVCGDAMGGGTPAPQVYNITYVTNGGTISNPSAFSQYTQGVGITLPTSSQITKTGYVFGGWYKEESLTTGPYGSIGTSATGNKTFYAKWDASHYTVTYVTNGGYITNSAAYTGYNYGEGLTFPKAGQVTRSGYTFKGWYSDSALTLGPYSGLSKTATGNKTYYAKWEANSQTYSVMLNRNGGTIKSGNITSYTYGVGATLPTDVTKTGCVFKGWYTTSDFSGSPVTNISSTDSGNKTFYAKWDTAYYNLTIGTDGGRWKSGGSSTKVYSVPYLAYLTNYLEDVEKTGFHLEGWAVGNTVYLTKTETPNKVSYNVTSDVYVEPAWRGNTYYLTFDNSPASGGIKYMARFDQDLPSFSIPTRSGYTFGGYYSGKNGTGNQYYNSNGVAVRKYDQPNDFTIYAYWIDTAPYYTLSFNSMGGTSCSSRSLRAGSVIDSLCTPSKSGYTFGGWYTSSYGNGSRVENNTYSISNNMTLYARWIYDTERSASTYKADGCSGSLSNAKFIAKYECVQGNTGKIKECHFQGNVNGTWYSDYKLRDNDLYLCYVNGSGGQNGNHYIVVDTMTHGDIYTGGLWIQSGSLNETISCS